MIIRIPAIAALALALVVTGCTSPPDTSDSARTATAAAETETVVEDAVARTANPRPWAHESSDIPVDPRINFGHFSNGLRYAWVNNSEPNDRVYVRLHVDIGSLAEEMSELGMAHFLEHMAFNGSENFEAGTLVEWFQEQGMSFGADTNAHTSFSETVYKLDLPKSDAATLRSGLMVLRDFADRLDIADAEVQAEKGVIDGEQRERDSAQMRVMQKQLDIMFADTRIGDRLPIGTKEVRDQFTGETVRAFYERWYRPEHMTLVVVGDLGEVDPVPLMAEAFAGMPVPAAPLMNEPGPGDAPGYSFSYAVHEAEIPTLQLSFGMMKPWVEKPVTAQEWVSNLPLAYARSMLNLRFRELAKKESAPFLSAGASSNAIFQVYDGEGLSISANPDKWEAALAAGEQELRRALEFGFQQGELDEVRADALRSLDEAVAREATAPSRRLLGRILAAAENPTVPTNAATRRDIVKPAIEALTIEACHAAFTEAWSEGELSMSATGNLDLGDDAGTKLRAAYDKSRSVSVEPKAEAQTSEFAYASNPSVAGKVTKRDRVEDFGFDMIQFDNGVSLNVKRTEFRENQVIVSIQTGEGSLTCDPKDLLALQMIAGPVMNGGGLEAHSNDDIRRLTAGKQVGVGFGIGADRFTISGGTTAEDLLMELELAAAYLRAPGWRDEGLVQMRRQLPMMYMGMKHQHQGPAMMEFLPALYDGDPRFGFPKREALEGKQVDDVKAWLAPHLVDAPIEIAIVGDLDVEETIAMVARTFGTLPKRREWRTYDEHRNAPAPKAGLKQTHEIQTQVPKSLVLIFFPTTDGIDMLARRKQHMLNQIVNDRLRLEVRERLGAAYSPGSRAQPSTTMPGVGSIMIQAMSDPDKVDTLVDACLAVGDALATEGITDEEIDRLREPILNQRRDAKRTNGWWLQTMGRAQSDAAHLDSIRSGDEFWGKVNAAEIAPLAKEYLTSDRASVLIVNPSKSQ